MAKTSVWGFSPTLWLSSVLDCVRVSAGWAFCVHTSFTRWHYCQDADVLNSLNQKLFFTVGSHVVEFNMCAYYYTVCKFVTLECLQGKWCASCKDETPEHWLSVSCVKLCMIINRYGCSTNCSKSWWLRWTKMCVSAKPRPVLGLRQLMGKGYMYAYVILCGINKTKHVAMSVSRM